MIEFECYDFNNREEKKKPYSLPQTVNDISFYYDGGRLIVSINGDEVYSTNLAGNDFSLQIDNK